MSNDLKVLFDLLKNRKRTIVLLSLIGLIGIGSLVYFRSINPLYEGRLLIEIAEYEQKDKFLSVYNPVDLKYIIEAESSLMKSKIKGIIPGKSSRLLILSAVQKEKDIIETDLKSIFKILNSYEKNKLKFVKNYRLSKKIGEIQLSNEPINSLKIRFIILLFVMTFLLSVIVSIVLELISREKNKNGKSE